MPTVYRLYKLFFFTLLIALFAACGPEPITQDMVVEEPVKETVPEEQATEEAPLNIPSVVDEVVDAKEEPIEMAEPEPEPVIAEPEIIEDVETEAVVENNASEPETPEVATADANTTAPVEEELSVAEDANTSLPPEEEPAVAEAPPFEPYIEQIGVLKIGIEEHAVRLKMKDPIIKYFALTSPDRIVIDFKDIRYLEPVVKDVNAPFVIQIATATHDDYNRVVIYLKEAKTFTISKNRGDWLVDLK
jgi:hypothetical protein